MGPFYAVLDKYILFIIDVVLKQSNPAFCYFVPTGTITDIFK